MRTLKLRVEYLGTAYRGWQIQPDQPTVQGCLETALSSLFGERVRVAGSGRTDAGVHARGQVASFRIVSKIPCLGILRGGNHFLPEDIRIVSVEEAPEGFHARHHAVRKDYAYRLSQAPVLSPFLAATVVSIRGKLDLSRMESAAAHFLGRHDFTAFCGAEGRRRNTVRTVVDSRFDSEPGEVAVFRISADGFLQYLVRTIVGTLIEVGRGRIEAEVIPEILDARDRTRAGPTAAAKGLTLEKVHFPDGM